MGPTNIKFVGSPCGQHGPYTFYKAFKFRKNSKTSILSLGEFFFVKIFKDVEVCIGELQLLWEDRYNPGSFLSMVRLYFLPEQTPEGRKAHHGEDEVLMESDKVPFLLDDLVSLLASDIEWTAGSQAMCSIPSRSLNLPVLKNQAVDVLKTFDMNNKGLDMREINRERENLDDQEYECLGSQVVILNYTQYCRFRAMSKRLEGCKDSWMKDVVAGAMGAMITMDSNSKVLFCRDMFEHPVIQEHEMRQDHLAPNLRGRPKKKRMNFRKYEKDHVYSNDSDSCDSASSSEKSSARSTPPKIKDKRQSSPVPMKSEKPRIPMVPVAVKAMGKGVVSLKKKSLKEQQEEDAIDISPFKSKGVISKDEEKFLKKLGLFMKKNHIRMSRLPTLGFKPVDLYQFYLIATKLGGYEQVTEKRKWKHIYDKLGGSAGNTSAATCTRRHYEKFLLAYEKYVNGQKKIPLHTPVKMKKSKLENAHSQPISEVKSLQATMLIKKKIKDLVRKDEVPGDINQEVDQKVLGQDQSQVSSLTQNDGNYMLAQTIATSTANTPQPMSAISQTVSSVTGSLASLANTTVNASNGTFTANHQSSSLQNVQNFSHGLNSLQRPISAALNVSSVTNPRFMISNNRLQAVGQRPPLKKSLDAVQLSSPAVQNVLRPPTPAHNNNKTTLYLPSSDPASHSKSIPPAHAHKKVNAPPQMFPVGPVTHSMLYTASQTGKPKAAFLNPPPIPRNLFATHIVYGEPFIRQTHPPNEIAQMKRCISLGKANMNLNLVTPPPAHCNPCKSVGINGNNKKRPYHLPVQKTYTTSQVTAQRSGPSQPKKPRLVSDYLTLNAPHKSSLQNILSKSSLPNVPSKKILPNAPPKNPFVNKNTENIAVSNQLTNTALQLPNSMESIKLPQVQQPPLQNRHIINNSVAITTTKTMNGPEVLADFSAKPLSVHVPVKNAKVNSGRVDSPIVISPAISTEEPVNLCVKAVDGTNSNNIVMNAANLFSKLSPLTAAPPSAIIPFVAMQNNVVSVTPNNLVSITPTSIVSMAPNNISVNTNTVVRPVVAIPNNMLPCTNRQNPINTGSSASLLGEVNQVQVKQTQQQLARVVTPKAGDPPPLSPQVHPAFPNGTVQPQIVLPAQLTTPSGVSQTGAGNGVNIAMVPYMIPLQQIQQLYSQAQQQQVAVTVSTSLSNISK